MLAVVFLFNFVVGEPLWSLGLSGGGCCAPPNCRALEGARGSGLLLCAASLPALCVVQVPFVSGTPMGVEK